MFARNELRKSVAPLFYLTIVDRCSRLLPGLIFVFSNVCYDYFQTKPILGLALIFLTRTNDEHHHEPQ
jgi:hypothetical protein